MRTERDIAKAARRIRREDPERYQTELIEAYNVAIGVLQEHQSGDPDPDGIDWLFRMRLARKLDAEIQRWVDLRGR